MSDRFESLESGEVVSIQHESQVLSGHRTFRSGELNDAIKSYVESAIPGWSEDKNDWFTDRGIDCEALRFGSKGWQKGRIRLSLEFCPDEPSLPALSASDSSIPAATNSIESTNNSPLTLSDSPVSAVASHEEVLSFNEDTLVATATSNTIPDQFTAVTPVAEMAAVGAVAATMSGAIPDLEPVRESVAIPHFADTVLEPEHHDLDSISPISGSLDEIAFDFGEADSDRGRMIPNGMMEIDLADGLDFSEHDLLSFEANGMSDSAEGFGSFQDIGRPENSGMLIDEVWSEVDRADWPKVN